MKRFSMSLIIFAILSLNAMERSSESGVYPNLSINDIRKNCIPWTHDYESIQKGIEKILINGDVVLLEKSLSQGWNVNAPLIQGVLCKACQWTTGCQWAEKNKIPEGGIMRSHNPRFNASYLCFLTNAVPLVDTDTCSCPPSYVKMIQYYYMPLHLTIKHVSTSEQAKHSIYWLLNNEANPNEQDKIGNTPAHCLIDDHIAFDDIYEILKVLRSKGALFDVSNTEGKTIVYKICQKVAPTDHAKKVKLDVLAFVLANINPIGIVQEDRIKLLTILAEREKPHNIDFIVLLLDHLSISSDSTAFAKAIHHFEEQVKNNYVPIEDKEKAKRLLLLLQQTDIFNMVSQDQKAYIRCLPKELRLELYKFFYCDSVRASSMRADSVPSFWNNVMSFFSKWY